MNQSHLSANQQTMSPARQQAQLKHLEGIADKIREENLKVESYMRHTVKHALLAGKLLCEVKRMVGHGNWLEWFHAQRFTFGEVTAQRYMRLFRSWPEIQTRIVEAGNPSSLTDLTFNDALGILSTPVLEVKEGGGKPHKPAKKTLANSKACNRAGSSEASEAEPNRSSLMVQPTQAVAWQGNGQQSVDWLTPKSIVEAAQRVLGRIDLDPAADAYGNVPAARRYTPAEDGLGETNQWHGNVFLNPPCDQGLLEKFVLRLLSESEIGRVTESILLVPSQTDAHWYRSLRNFARVFIARTDESTGIPAANGLTAIYLGNRQTQFFDVFQELGDGFIPYRLCLEAGTKSV